MKHTLIAAFLLLLPSLAGAQSTVTVAWDHIGIPPAVVAAYTQAVLIDDVVQPGKATCAARAGAAADTTCTMTIPTPSNAPHTITVRSSLGANVAEAVLTNWNPATGPTPASGIRTTVTVTVVIGSPGGG